MVNKFNIYIDNCGLIVNIIYVYLMESKIIFEMVPLILVTIQIVQRITMNIL